MMQWVIRLVPNSFWHNMLDNLPEGWENYPEYTINKDYKYEKVRKSRKVKK